MEPLRRAFVLGTLAAGVLLSSGCAGQRTVGARMGGQPTPTVEIRLISFRPERLVVAVGTTVTWHQRDPGVHTVTSGTVEVSPSGTISTRPDGRFQSGSLQRGQRFSHRFTRGGTYPYFCEVHPATMRGLIEVRAS